MMASVALFVMALLLAATFAMELWFGIAVMGWSGDRAIVHRDKSPGPYWFVMAVQTFVLIVLPILYAFY